MSEHPSGGRHPEIEEIAALVDGRVAGEDRARLVVHLADCDDCRELFAETARFAPRAKASAGSGSLAATESGDPARVLRPAASRWRRSGLIAGGLVAAAAALAAVLVWTPAGGLLDLGGEPPGVAELTASLPPASALSPILDATWDDHGWRVTRGAGPAPGPDQERAFQVGVRVVEMDLALAAGDAELAEALTYRLESLLTDADPLRFLYAGDVGIRGRLEAGEPTDQLLPVNRQADELLAPAGDGEVPGFVDPFWYRLGRWAGAAQLAAAAGDAGFLADRSTRRYLRDLEDEELPAQVAAPLRDVTALTADDPAGNLPQIERQLRALIAVAGGGSAAEDRGTG